MTGAWQMVSATSLIYQKFMGTNTAQWLLGTVVAVVELAVVLNEESQSLYPLRT
jgi:hypothetical protein